MVQINNSDLTKALVDGARLHAARDVIPDQLARVVVPVMEVNPELLRRVNIVASGATTTTGTTTIFTTPSDRDFFLTSAYLQNQSNATADNTQIRLGITTDFASINLLIFQKLTTTAFTDSVSAEYNTPIKLKRNSAINIIHTFTVGASGTAASITGYIVEPAS